MSNDRLLSQEEIDSVFKKASGTRALADAGSKAESYDFRRPDRIAKDQLRSIHLLHESFARSLSFSLSAYLRAYVVVNLVSVEQLSFREFTQVMPSPSSILCLGLTPFDGNAVLELNPSLVFPLLEMLLGAGEKAGAVKIDRELTEIEQSIIEAIYRLILKDLKEAWQAISLMSFSIESHEKEPSLLQMLAPNEAVVAISLEIRIGEITGMMNLGIPSVIIKMLRQKFDQQWSVRKTDSTIQDQSRILRLVKQAKMNVEVRLQGPTLTVENLLNLEEGDVLNFDYPLNRPIDLLINGKMKYQGDIVAAGGKKGFMVSKPYLPMED